MLKSKRILLAVLSVGLLIAGCKDKEDVKPAASLTARAGADQNVKVGDVVTLDGSGSTDSENKTFTYSWTFSKKPAGSTVALAKPAESKTTFTPDLPGDYEVEIKISNEHGQSTDKVVVTATMIEPIVLEVNIKDKKVLEDRVANPDIPDYIVNANVQVNSELTIKPGVVIAFARDTRIEVNDTGGVLLAKGDSAKPIRLIGKETSKGFWGGIVFRSANGANELEYVEVSHAGSKPLINTIKAGMAIIGSSRANISIKHCLFQKNDGYGLFIEERVVLTGFEKNTFSENTEAGIRLNADNVAELDANSIFSKANGRNIVEIYASTLSKNLNTEIIWAGFKDKTPYRILEGLGSDANWKLMPGVILEMGRGARLSIDDGYFNAKGTADSKIIIKPAENERAYWRGMICYSQNTKNLMEHVDFYGGGSIALVSGKKTNIAIYGGGARMEIRNSRIAGSGGYGIYVNYQATVNEDIETANVFADNVEAKLLQE
ncbi:hypothetical protein DYBT9623_02727 [Dyadobacter sp. CECT 9623]|uniref:PKD domain-containing protein n=1 Tax=Dyadobacter linearis TaxID=2823330 RepID=A0ABN7RDI4_9BACT|nr:PKD domain-containing protein [Dyadobacter sp. CECT 9623]CAG5069987.1 hypothetical protein DYBT9623_02727 [Dyadobacter sp. CECT 9623]